MRVKVAAGGALRVGEYGVCLVVVEDGRAACRLPTVAAAVCGAVFSAAFAPRAGAAGKTGQVGAHRIHHRSDVAVGHAAPRELIPEVDAEGRAGGQ